jgi:hypothetical protein
VENVCSDIVIYILIFILERRPFSKRTFDEFDVKSGNKNLYPMTPVLTTKLIRSPSLISKLSPSLSLTRSPAMLKRISSLTTKNLTSLNPKATTVDSKNILMRYASAKQTINEEIDEGVADKNVPIVRKKMNNLKNLEKEEYDKWYNIKPAVKQEIKSDKVNHDDDEGPDSDDDQLTDENNCEGYLFKITNSKKFKKLWFKLIHKDFYYYKTKEESKYKGMHSLAGVFLREEPTMTFGGVAYFSFSVIYPRKARIYYCEDLEQYNKWIKSIQKATGYFNLSDIYDIKDKVGNGKFGLVRLGFHKESGRKVAIKIMNKKEMSIQDLELIKTEIEILKVCQHPNIIQLYDVYENAYHIYIGSITLIFSYGILFWRRVI